MTPYLIAFLGYTLLLQLLVTDAKPRLALAVVSVTIAVSAPALSDWIVARAESEGGSTFTRISEVADVR